MAWNLKFHSSHLKDNIISHKINVKLYLILKMAGDLGIEPSTLYLTGSRYAI